MADPALPGVVVAEKLAADHIVSMKRITEMPGFKNLSYENMLRVLNYEPNFIGLSRAANSSKGERSFAEWIRHDGRGVDVEPAFRARMIAEETRLKPVLEQMIQALLKAQ